MDLPRDQLVSDLLHQIASLIQEADAYLCESSLSPATFASSSKKRPSPKMCATPFAKAGKKKREKKGMFSAIKRPRLRKAGISEFKSDAVSLRMRGADAKLNKPKRDVLRSERRRKDRSNYQRSKLTGKPETRLGSRLRKR
jgi:hypothetical protein